MNTKRRRSEKPRPAPDAAVHALLQWFAGEGGLRGSIDIGEVDGLRGLVATQPIAAGELLLGVPRALIFGLDEARDTPLGRQLHDVDGLDERAVLAVGLVSLRRHGGRWRPMVEAMPRAFRERPDGWERHDWDLLRGSQVARLAREGWKKLEQQHQRAGVRVALRAFAWGYLAACTRAMGLDGDSGLAAIAPVADMLNHANDGNCAITGEHARMLEVRALRSVDAGEALTCSYGELPNAVLLQRYGFCLAHNVHDRASLRVALPVGHWLADAAAREPTAGDHAIGHDPLDEHGRRLFNFLRVSQLPRDDGHALLAQAGDADIPVLQVPNEQAVLQRLGAECEARLAAFDDAIDVDDALLATATLTPSQRHAVTARRGEKRILLDTLAQARRGARALALEGTARAQALQTLSGESGWGRYFAAVQGRLAAA